MKPQPLMKNKRVTVMGLGLHGGGLATVNWLLKNQARVTVTDLRSKKILKPALKKIKKSKRINFVLGYHRLADFKKADYIFKNPGVPKESNFLKIAKSNNIPIETDLSYFFKLCQSPIIGITGTKGKSTTTTLIYEILKKSGRQVFIGGNIRVSPLNFLSETSPQTIVILELSSWQLEDMSHLHRSPHLAVITNILPDHLNRYRNFNEYVDAKKLIIKWQDKRDLAVINYDNASARKLGRIVKSRRFWFTTRRVNEVNACFVKNGWIIFRVNGRTERVCKIEKIKLMGRHNLQNILAAVAVAKVYGVKNKVICSVLESFDGVPGRLQLIRTYKGRDFYNDTTATAPISTVAALDCFKNREIILLAGGSDKNLYYEALARKIKKSVAKTILFKGTATNKILRCLKKLNYRNYSIVSNMKQAVKLAWASSSEKSLILLSPGAASFGIFLNEFDRGDQFVQAVKLIK